VKCIEMNTATSSWCYDPNDKIQRFHEFHSFNVRLSEDRRLASRQGSFNGLCFSAKPLVPNFPLVIKIVDSEAGWIGHLRVGITTIDPATLPNLNSREFIQQTLLVSLPGLPQSLTSYSSEISSAVCIYFKPISPGHINAFAIINEKDICLNKEPINVGENKQVFAVVDVFGQSKSVQITPVKKSVLRLSTICERKICQTLTNVKSADSLPLPKVIKQNINTRSSITPVIVI